MEWWYQNQWTQSQASFSQDGFKTKWETYFEPNFYEFRCR
jgi:hypothetical protein